jgi:GTPase
LSRLKEFGVPIYVISAATSKGLDPVKWALWREIEEHLSKEVVPIIVPTYRSEDASAWDVEKSEIGFRVTGKRVIKLVEMTNLGNRDAVHMLYRKLKRIGVIDRLVEMGVERGDDVYIGDFEFAYEEW